MAWKWFVQLGELIEGPFSTEDVQNRLRAGQLAPQHLIWGPGLEQWLNLKSWTQELSNLSSSDTQHPGVPEAWHYAAQGVSRGPMPRQTLIGELKGQTTLSDVMIWTKGMKEWAPLFEFHDLLNEIGVNKRQFPRCDVTGKVVIRGSGTTLIAPLLSISEGGFSITLSEGLVSGESLSVELQCPSFREVLHAKAEVRYASQGIVGLKFTQISVETRGAIIQFIKQNQMRFAIKAA